MTGSPALPQSCPTMTRSRDDAASTMATGSSAAPTAPSSALWPAAPSRYALTFSAGEEFGLSRQKFGTPELLRYLSAQPDRNQPTQQAEGLRPVRLGKLWYRRIIECLAAEAGASAGLGGID